MGTVATSIFWARMPRATFTRSALPPSGGLRESMASPILKGLFLTIDRSGVQIRDISSGPCYFEQTTPISRRFKKGSNMKYRKSTAVIAIVGILFSSAMGAKSASAETKTNSTAASASAPPSDLQALVGLQSPAEISAIQNSGPAELIYDTTAHKYVAAKKIQSIMTPNALQLVGPGCSTVSACMYVNGTTPNG